MSTSNLIRIRGARVHNLKNVSLDLPLHRLIAVTGVSGAGKGSLAFDTLCVEGQRRYIETFSTRTRQFLERLEKPDADRVEGVPPAIGVKGFPGGRRRPGRATVGTVSDVHDLLSLLLTKFGQVACPACGERIAPASASSVLQAIGKWPEGMSYLIGYPLELSPTSDRTALANSLREHGFTRVRVNGVIHKLGSDRIPSGSGGDDIIEVIVDRLRRGSDEAGRCTDSIEVAFGASHGRCVVIPDSGPSLSFIQGWKCGGCGRSFPEPETRLFHYGSPLGACPTCEGLGRISDFDVRRIVPDPSLSLRAGAIAPWNDSRYSGMRDEWIVQLKVLGIDVDVSFKLLPEAHAGRILDGAGDAGPPGVRPFLRNLQANSSRRDVRAFLKGWKEEGACPDCQGSRLCVNALAVRIDGENIASLSNRTVGDLMRLLPTLIEKNEKDPVARRILSQMEVRLAQLKQIGLGHLPLSRSSRSLSTGELRRLGLAAALGSGLVHALYVLDEPASGLHPVDVECLIISLRRLRDAGNSLIVVEHDLEVIRASDLMLDLGPGAGEAGGEVLYLGPPAEVSSEAGSRTGEFLTGQRSPRLPENRRQPAKGTLQIRSASGHNLKSINVDFPLGLLCVVTGVSGSGKSTLVCQTLAPALRRRLGLGDEAALPFQEIVATRDIQEVAMLDPTPIGRSGRSNPVTYLKAFDEIRKTFAATHEARLRNYAASRFSFNVAGGRCETCEGNGYQTIDMQFLPDVLVSCPECRGTRYRPETLEITYRGKNVAEVLDLTAREAFAFFRHRPKVQAKLRPILDVGLDYLRLGQPASTLSGGEAQRLKLAGHLASSPGAITRAAGKSHALFLLDEPTAGLHSADILKLLDAFESLINLGHSMIVIDHSPHLVLAADWIIDMGPGAGPDGGLVVAEGPPEAVATADTPTGRWLARLLAPR